MFPILKMTMYTQAYEWLVLSGACHYYYRCFSSLLLR